MSTSFLLPPSHPPLKSSANDRAPLHLGLRSNLSCPKIPPVKLSFPPCNNKQTIQAVDSIPTLPCPSPYINPPVEEYPSTFPESPISDVCSPISPQYCDLDNRRRSQTSLKLRKSQSTLIMPSFLGLFKPNSSCRKDSSGGITRDISTRSLSAYIRNREPLIRKCNTVIALSSVTSGSTTSSTKIVKERKSRLSFIKRISPTKSSNPTFQQHSASTGAFIHSSSTNQALFSLQQRNNPKTPSSTSLYHHNEAEDFNFGSRNFDDSADLPITSPLREGEEFHSTSHSKLAERWSAGSGCFKCNSFSSRVDSRCSRTTSVCNDDTVFCRLCYADVSVREMWQLAQCQCRFCARCMSDYCNFRIRQADAIIECPDANCDCAGEFTLEEVNMLVNRDMFALFNKHRRERDVDIDPLRTWCPTPGCETVVPLLYPKHSGAPTRVVCTVCSEPFCTSCSTVWHEGVPCYDPKNIGRDIPISASIKRCPRCRIPIERDEGCAQMQCRKCKHVFCWYCLNSLEDDFLLRHYDKGPCKNKLGHSRASVLWHRAQVVLIFCGFGLMLVVASPLLLFVGPCLLCRTCRGCKMISKDDDDDEFSEESV